MIAFRRQNMTLSREDGRQVALYELSNDWTDGFAPNLYVHSL
jgi:hypothetical protein